MTSSLIKIRGEEAAEEREEDSDGEEGRATGEAIMRASPSIDLFVGCCIADLISPQALAAQLLEIAGDKGGLLYLPITFAGKTELLRGSSVEAERDECSDTIDGSYSKRLPSDEIVMRAYHAHLEKTGHFLSPSALLKALSDHGCRSLLPPGAPLPPSPWRISPKTNPYFFRSMQHFLALGTVFQLLGDWNVVEWFRALNKAKANNRGRDLTIVAHNVDLLLRLPEIPQNIALPGQPLSTGDTRVIFGNVTHESASPCGSPFPAPGISTRPFCDQ